MRLKKLSIAAALSLGILTVSGIANAASSDFPQAMVPSESCPVQQTVCPVSQPCPTACPTPCETGGPCPAAAACAPCGYPLMETYKRQVYGYPALGSSSVVMPRGSGLIQMGGARDRVAAGNQTSTGMTALPESGTHLKLFPKWLTGAAAPTPRGCKTSSNAPDVVMQGVDILRNQIPSNSPIYKSSVLEGITGKAVPIAVGPYNPCSTGLFDSPCEAYGIESKGFAGGAGPIAVCSPDKINVKLGDPSVSLYAPIPFPNGDPYGITGAAAPVQNNPLAIETAGGIPVQQTVVVPTAPIAQPCEPAPCPSGGACPVKEQFPDVSNNQYAGCDINKLAVAGVLAGYPDRTYKPNLPILRSELASAMVAGLQLENIPGFSQQIFRDVPKHHWAKADIDKAYNRGLMAGFPNDYFKPNKAVTRAEALASMAKAIPGDMSSSEAQNILKSYPDGNEVPNWASIPVAESLNAGLAKNICDNSCIKPNIDASRADVAEMVKELRVKLCLEPSENVTAAVPCAPTGGASYVPQVVCTSIPTLKVKMDDIVSARTGEVGDIFRARTVEQVKVNGLCFPAHSIVSGRVVEVIRPTIGDHGAIRLAFDRIESEKGDFKTNLPQEVLGATVIKDNNPNFVARTLSVPFSLPGKAVGIAGRTVGGAIIIAGNAVEGVGTNLGNGTNELFDAKARAAGRSYLTAGKDILRAPADIIVAGATGSAGIVKESFDDVAYIVSPDGRRIAQINPREVLSIAFSNNCPNATSKTACACPNK